jgi:hypothetical protein
MSDSVADKNANAQLFALRDDARKLFQFRWRQNVRIDKTEAEALDSRGKVFMEWLRRKALVYRVMGRGINMERVFLKSSQISQIRKLSRVILTTLSNLNLAKRTIQTQCAVALFSRPYVSPKTSSRNGISSRATHSRSISPGVSRLGNPDIVFFESRVEKKTNDSS